MTNRNEFSQRGWGLDKIDACRGGRTNNQRFDIDGKIYVPARHPQSLLWIYPNNGGNKAASSLPGIPLALKNWTPNKSVRGLT